jgi:hypothetical protein
MWPSLDPPSVRYCQLARELIEPSPGISTTMIRTHTLAGGQLAEQGRVGRIVCGRASLVLKKGGVWMMDEMVIFLN